MNIGINATHGHISVSVTLFSEDNNPVATTFLTPMAAKMYGRHLIECAETIEKLVTEAKEKQNETNH